MQEPSGPGPDAATEDWEALMQAALGGDQGAYAQLLRSLTRWLRAYYRRRLPPGLDEDAAQDALIAAHEKRHTYQPGKPLLPWVAAIARYKWIDRLRGMRHHEELQEDALPAPDHEGPIASALLLDALLKRLKPAQASVIRLVKLQGYSIAEASRTTGQSESLVKVNIHRGIAILAREAERTHDEDAMAFDAP